jgi:hypothetical protein
MSLIIVSLNATLYPYHGCVYPGPTTY